MTIIGVPVTPETVGLVTILGLLFWPAFFIYLMMRKAQKNKERPVELIAEPETEELEDSPELQGGFFYTLDNITLKFELWGDIWHSFLVIGEQQSKIDVPGSQDIGSQFWRTLNYLKIDKHQRCFDLPVSL